ncbi:MAG: glycosyltransferase [Armatimonadetes bacterium]|nr:glycosyltransferase [Armatimonadota bacterium]
MTMVKTAAILPAYNEEARVKGVLDPVRRASLVDEIVVVNDGSTDATAQRVLEVPGVFLVSLPRNLGKGGAMAAGARFTDADILLFLDADLIGLTAEHVDALIEPIRSGRALMAVGRFCGGRRITDLSQRIAPSISGQRAIAREVFEQIPGVASVRYGVEMQITRFCRFYRIPIETVPLAGVTHLMKEEKLGVFRGWASRGRMYGQILRIMLDPRAPKRSLGRTLRMLRGSSVIGMPPSPFSLQRWLSRLNGKRTTGRQPRIRR